MARTPQPTHLKLVKGVSRRDRINQAEPTAPAGMPERPSHLSGKESRAAWISFGKLLTDMGVLTLADGAALGRLCDVYAQVQRLQRDVENHGHVYEADRKIDPETGAMIHGSGVVRARPEVAMLADADRRLRQYLSDFGLTPSARSKVTLPNGAAAKTTADRFFG